MNKRCFMTTVLPVESPIVTITPSTCAVTAIIGTNMTKYQHIIWENYIQLEFGEPGYPNGGFSESYSWDKFDCLYVQEIHRDGLATSEVREIIIQGLKKNQYILTGIDRFDLSVYQEQYHKEHRGHRYVALPHARPLLPDCHRVQQEPLCLRRRPCRGCLWPCQHFRQPQRHADGGSLSRYATYCWL